MSGKPEFDAQAVIDAMAPMIGIEIDPDFREGVAANLKLTADLAQLVLSFPVEDGDQPAAVFEA
ncbi:MULTISPECIES: DUF4089 domain-containing protein [Labrys]|uniref:DUF4089 domain-containing protein n=1 Tax=Labrys TaxID=204476 RepID=UPI00082F8825|nr:MULTISPECIES: DUF4089 domain-containing protein [unclassified Labrys (in: a-proteobacteria)]MDZ5448456.1 DUF4089 domain-containing protein [Labrys sp. ZIDIC5]OCC06269.1 hypothetical protein BA190_03245 [Labrys sp. WJW]